MNETRQPNHRSGALGAADEQTIAQARQQLTQTAAAPVPAMSRARRRALPRRMGMSLAGAALAFVLALGGAPAARAYPAEGNAHINGTDCDLIDAIIAANSDTTSGGCAAGTPGADTIDLLDNVTLVTGVSFFDGLPAVTSTITINGNGFGIARDPGAPQFGIIKVSSGGNLTLNNATISSAYGFYGGIINEGGTLTVNNSTVTGNHSFTSAASGVHNEGGVVTINNSTVSGNSGVGIANYYGTLALSNSIVANQASDTDCGGTITSLGHNLDSDGSCGLTATGDISSGAANLGPLQVNAPGAAATYALLPGSQAINAGDCSGGTITSDQRGVSRPQGPACDIGAFELEQASDTTAPVLSLPGTITVNATSSAGAAVSYTVSATDPDNAPNELTISCAPPSGSTFAIGTTTVNCSASDPANNTATGSFQVVVQGAATQIGNLINLVNSFNLPSGLQTSLDGYLQTAQAKVNAGNINAACGNLTNFISLVNAQSGKKLTTSQAQLLLAAANNIMAVLGC
jgi:hypothetical protein